MHIKASRKLGILSGIMSIGLIAAALAAAPASAAEPTSPASTDATDGPRHCIANVTTPIAKVECFDSFTVAVSKATGGRITDAPQDAGKAAYDAAFEAKLRGLSKLAGQPGVQAQNIIEIDYDYGFWGTDTFTWWVENGGCESNSLGNVKYSVWNLADYGWNDRINAFTNDHLCFSKHFEHAGFQGLAIGWDYGRSSLGPLDGQISSIQWS
ncbi:hypothetical protein GA0074692_2202 [Micromonospora pallida]|uniref:Peptidase inhibitor family I36 n=2 Tax=Micromonospora pallida TaxID=145854 RepID=A0A1C6SAX4_9ACTN|nr:hypothetical protein GA0074692_2202 [Micromonospora pallida]